MGGIFYKNYSVSKKCLGFEGVSAEYKLEHPDLTYLRERVSLEPSILNPD